METGKEGQEKSMRIVQWIKKKHFDRLCKKYPILRVQENYKVFNNAIHKIYRTRLDDLLKACDILGFKHFYQCNQRLYYIWISDGEHQFKTVLIDPKLFDELENIGANNVTP